MISNPNSLPPQVKQTLEQYLCLKLGDKCIPCPYWINKSALNPFLWFNPAYTGKGTPSEITTAVQHQATAHQLDLSTTSRGALLRFMQNQNLGIDCSGFAYHLLDAWDRDRGGPGLSHRLALTPTWHPFSRFRQARFQINADYLTRPENSVLLNQLDQFRPGDLIRCEAGKHILVILEATSQHLVYAHSSHKFTKTKGVHLQQINLIQPKHGLEHQQWLEPTITDVPYNSQIFNSQQGDGVFRLKIWNQ